MFVIRWGQTKGFILVRFSLLGQDYPLFHFIVLNPPTYVICTFACMKQFIIFDVDVGVLMHVYTYQEFV